MISFFLLLNFQGTDITELFETHHLNMKASDMLSKYYIRDALEPRNILLTFEPNKFYKTLQGKVFKIVDSLDRRPALISKARLKWKANTFSKSKP